MADELQTLMDATFEQNGETSVLTFTQKLVDVGQPAITDESSWIFAVGLPDNQWDGVHKLLGSFSLPLQEGCTAGAGAAAPNTTSSSGSQAAGLVMRQDVTETTLPLWVAHGWTMAIAWGLLAPLAIGAAVLRSLVGSYWFKIHFYLNMMCVVSTIIGFSLAMVAIQIEEKPHFTGAAGRGDEDHVHHTVGLSIFIIVLLQSIVGYFRPPAAAPAIKGKDTNDCNDKPDSQRAETDVVGKAVDDAPQAAILQEEDQNSIETPLPKEFIRATTTDGEEDSSSLDTPCPGVAGAQQKQTKPAPSKTPALLLRLRKAWEFQHRLTGTVLIGLAWYNCHSGYQLIAENYDDSKDYTILFWCVTVAIGGSIFLLSYVIRV
jgi:hypothetical protein